MGSKSRAVAAGGHPSSSRSGWSALTTVLIVLGLGAALWAAAGGFQRGTLDAGDAASAAPGTPKHAVMDINLDRVTPDDAADAAPAPTLHTSPATGLTFYSTPASPDSDLSSLRWGIMFDAGSTGSRVHIYRFRLVAGVGPQAPVLEDEVYVEIKPGLSAYMPSGVGSDASTRDVGQTNKVGAVQGPTAAAASLKPLLELCLEQIPSAAHSRTPISLRATAGLRLLGEAEAESIMSSVRELFSSYPFAFEPRDVQVMTGSNEGVYAWLTVNYLRGVLADSKLPPVDPDGPEGPLPLHHGHAGTSAILDLGGASTQVVFEPSFSSYAQLHPAQQEALFTLPFGSNEYFLYETSYLGYGLMEARRRSKEALFHTGMLKVHPEYVLPLPDEGRVVVGVEEASSSDHGVPILYHPCLSPLHSEMLLGGEQGGRTWLRGAAHGRKACARVVKTLFPKHGEVDCKKPPCSFGGHFALPLASFAEEPSAPAIYAFSYFYDRTLEIFELVEETPGADGTVLKLRRIRELADEVCSYNPHVKRVLTPDERAHEEAQAKELHTEIEARRKHGCTKIYMKAKDGATSKIHLASDPSGAISYQSPPPEEPEESECTVREQPNVGLYAREKETYEPSPVQAMIDTNPYLCLDLTYAHTLLHYGYELPEHTDLHIMKRLKKKEIGWCLGAMLSQMAQRGW